VLKFGHTTLASRRGKTKREREREREELDEKERATELEMGD